MCEIETVLIVATLLLAASGFYIYQLNSGKKVGHYGDFKLEDLAERITKSTV